MGWQPPLTPRERHPHHRTLPAQEGVGVGFKKAIDSLQENLTLTPPTSSLQLLCGYRSQ
jgi:hypothetical protein